MSRRWDVGLAVDCSVLLVFLPRLAWVSLQDLSFSFSRGHLSHIHWFIIIVASHGWWRMIFCCPVKLCGAGCVRNLFFEMRNWTLLGIRIFIWSVLFGGHALYSRLSLQDVKYLRFELQFMPVLNKLKVLCVSKSRPKNFIRHSFSICGRSTSRVFMCMWFPPGSLIIADEVMESCWKWGRVRFPDFDGGDFFLLARWTLRKNLTYR